MAWRKGHHDEDFEPIDAEIKIVIHMMKSSTLQLTLNKDEDELQCAFEVVKEDQAPMSVFDLPPPIFPARVVVLTFEVQTPDKVHMVFSGNTNSFQANFVQRGIEGRSVKIEPTDLYGEYYRVLGHVSLAPDQTCVEELEDIFEGCLVGSPVVVRVKETKHDTEQLQNVVKLREATCQTNRNKL